MKVPLRDDAPDLPFPAILVRRFALAAGLVFNLVVGLSPVQAQQPEPVKVAATGTVEKVRPGLVIQTKTYQVQESKGKKNQGADPPANAAPNPPEKKEEPKIQVGLDPRVTKLKVFGSGGPSFLKAGQQIRLQGTITKEGKIVGEVRKVEVLLPDPQFVPAFEIDRLLPSFTKETVEPDQKGFQLQGIVASFRGGQLQVLAPPKPPVTVTIAQDAEVPFGVDALTLVQPGDQVTLRGFLVRPNQVLAEEISITLARPLGPNGRPTPAPAPTPTKTEKSEKTEKASE